MRRIPLFLYLGLLASALTPAALRAAAPTALGVFDGWGAFRESETPRCYALSKPAATIGSRSEQAFASIGFWPRARIRGQFYVRLSKPRRADSELRLSIGARRFILTGQGVHGWARDQRMDAAIIAAMRSAPSMSIEGRGAEGGAIADTYRLRGAATAIDAAALGCARLR
ncbi:hypothetical protein [Sphingopyxis sp. MWB1]|uniref:hypothetical protein n=1 Tax=Sphingopyxis sp. MWB1 TaxID=1537715 RepID=UPI000519F9A6|nr:hypothetical protein [Sphingopyxis sp. MWB1]